MRTQLDLHGCSKKGTFEVVHSRLERLVTRLNGQEDVLWHPCDMISIEQQRLKAFTPTSPGLAKTVPLPNSPTENQIANGNNGNELDRPKSIQNIRLPHTKTLAIRTSSVSIREGKTLFYC